MSYLSELRNKVGHDLLLSIGSGVIVHKDGKILLQKRADTGDWGYHGGAMEPGETFEEVVQRELFEETGLSVKAQDLQFFGLYAGDFRYIDYPNGDRVYAPAVVFHAEDFEGELRAQAEEVAELRWFDFEALPEAIFPANRPILEEFVKRSKENA